VSDEGRKRIAKNLYRLLQLSNLVPPECQLDSGEIEWSGEVPIDGGNKNVDMYKGLYLQSEDVRIKVIRSVNMKDENTVKRIRREVELWSEIYAVDKGKHVIPFHGFYSPDGIRLALVSPWVDNGNALAYVMKNDNVLDYKKLIVGIAAGIKVLHSVKPPIIHGNLRAEKVLISDQGQPLITDFALAKACFRDLFSYVLLILLLKIEGNLITQTTGESESCRWCAPEMLEEKAIVSTKGDVYSFGMTILQVRLSSFYFLSKMLNSSQLHTHEMPYVNINKAFHVYSKKREGDGLPDRPQDERVVKRGLDEGMWGLLCLCWSRDAEHRPSINELEMKLLKPAEQLPHESLTGKGLVVEDDAKLLKSAEQPLQEPITVLVGNTLGVEDNFGGENHRNGADELTAKLSEGHVTIHGSIKSSFAANSEIDTSKSSNKVGVHILMSSQSLIVYLPHCVRWRRSMISNLTKRNF
ncbi:kinase-like domain-containing protein, partial [Amanita rubescens]